MATRAATATTATTATTMSPSPATATTTMTLSQQQQWVRNPSRPETFQFITHATRRVYYEGDLTCSRVLIDGCQWDGSLARSVRPSVPPVQLGRLARSTL